ncbi:hypothetical protein FZEAL_5762 [Fusarium zealandicum]|uniref:Fungal-type protein kinase domain-containing protein n=1 Tax=Fusarium zealandicum TaxID=1053134 RepID=A0A8H4UJN1_9HYPO|nr:hypothetical protein FZEAL_5762 [Fusarium zealandicum]
MLQLVKARKVWGVVQLFHGQHVETISNLRRGLHFTTIEDSHASSNSMAAQMHSLQGPSLAAGMAKLRWLSNSNNASFTDLTLSCLVVSPLGRSLDKFDTILEFLEGFRDAIKAHRSLYLDGKVLHQDISTGNIMIPEVKKNGEPRGLIIDLDNAMELAVGPPTPARLVGTKPFMAIDLLALTPHTYRHDLESFLYVFLLIAICDGHKQLPPKSRLQGWQVGSWAELAKTKTQDMADDNFATIIFEFTPKFRDLGSLAYSLREALFFPLQDGALFMGTKPGMYETGRLYARMIGAFEAAVSLYNLRIFKARGHSEG